MKLVVIDTGVANRYSIMNALRYIECDPVLSRDPAEIRSADKLVLPGVGAFSAGMRSLHARNLVDLLTEQVVHKNVPILGICLGLQLMAQTGFEDGETLGLGWIEGTVRRLTPSDPSLKVPHVGFNSVRVRRGSRLFSGLPPETDFYFVHGYYLDCSSEIVAGTFDYGDHYTAAIEQKNVFAVQFHPEKSQKAGLTVLRNFAAMDCTPC